MSRIDWRVLSLEIQTLNRGVSLQGSLATELLFAADNGFTSGACTASVGPRAPARLAWGTLGRTAGAVGLVASDAFGARGIFRSFVTLGLL